MKLLYPLGINLLGINLNSMSCFCETNYLKIMTQYSHVLFIFYNKRSHLKTKIHKIYWIYPWNWNPWDEPIKHLNRSSITIITTIFSFSCVLSFFVIICLVLIDLMNNKLINGFNYYVIFYNNVSHRKQTIFTFKL